MTFSVQYPTVSWLIESKIVGYSVENGKIVALWLRGNEQPEPRVLPLEPYNLNPVVLVENE